MRLLLDTHLYIWIISDSKKLSNQARNMILDAVEVYISSASIWEIGIKVMLGKLDLDIDLLVDSISESGFLNLPITIDHVVKASRLPNLHKDPFDRVLIAQAMVEPLTFLTADKTLKNYSDLVKVI